MRGADACCSAWVSPACWSSAFVPLNELNDDFVKYFSERIEFRRDADFASQNLSGLYLIDYSLESGQDGGISDPAFQHNGSRISPTGTASSPK